MVELRYIGTGFSKGRGSDLAFRAGSSLRAKEGRRRHSARAPSIGRMCTNLCSNDVVGQDVLKGGKRRVRDSKHPRAEELL